MNNAAASMHVIESQEDLFCDLLDEMGRDAFALVALDEPEQVLAEDLEDHAVVLDWLAVVGRGVEEVVEDAHHVCVARVCGVCARESTQQVDFVARSAGAEKRVSYGRSEMRLRRGCARFSV